MKKNIYIIISIFVLYFTITYAFQEDHVLWLIASLLFSVGFFSFYKFFEYIFTWIKAKAKILTKERIWNGIHSSSGTSRSFKFTFLVDNIKYTMPDWFSIGWFKEYNVDDTLIVYITDNIQKNAIPLQWIIYLLFIWITLMVWWLFLLSDKLVIS